ncbi:ABC transporter ATP-binding protein [Capnocytophaga canimorsus]|uniref:ABC transporter ATP-binding protein n=1 Tax=Capnocytophaga canimorsus TaxID=28188 RepID=UPI001ACB2CAE|nr:ABC transporter ATP-binding protein [Capnocytophaga canimorsus]GIM58834.1 hypothetical protein CAPN007_10420 [Capnocytophaga canimorsus]
MTDHQKRVSEVRQFFENKDTILGFRRLLDVAADTQDMDIYRRCIALTDWKSHHESEEADFITKSLELLEDIGKFSVTVADRSLPVLEAKGIAKSYGIGKFYLSPISISIKKGEIYGLVGENGNGKTTLLRILAKDLSHNVGNLKYHFNSKPKDAYDLRTKLVYIPQRTEKWYGSLLDNLRFVLSNYGTSPNEIEPRVLMMVARLGLWKYRHLKWSELSSGYKMRFELARTLLRKPEILLLDEPLANLDVLAQQVILEDLKSICASLSHPIALILSSQQLYEVEKISDQVIFLKQGKYQDLKSSQMKTPQARIIEIDTSATREQLMQVFEELPLEQIQFNGGIFVVYFDTNLPLSEVLIALGRHKIPITYLRDITLSTRRFFVN